MALSCQVSWNYTGFIVRLSRRRWPGDSSQPEGHYRPSCHSMWLNRRCFERLIRYMLRAALWRYNSMKLVMQGKAANTPLGRSRHRISMKKQCVENRDTDTAVFDLCNSHMRPEQGDASGFTLLFRNVLAQQ